MGDTEVGLPSREALADVLRSLAAGASARQGVPETADIEAFTRLAQRSARERHSILVVARDVLASSGRLVGQESP
jgi:hypothetical protein